MTHTIGLAKQELAGYLTAAGIKTFDYIPERIQPPTAIVSAGEPFLEAGNNKTFQDTLIRLDVTVIAGTAANIKSTDQLEDLLCKTVMALAEWDMETVSRPFQLEANGAFYLAAKVTVSAYITIKEVI